ncbi:MAG TPA: hypothetical protein VME70_07770 [Mycobacteriales bacterium]|nr:hypothetical protein [Mycobacteriales bacterium]
MTVARFESPGGTPETQALNCFQRLKDFLDSVGGRFDSMGYLTVEVAEASSIEPVMRARRIVFGDHPPRSMANRLAELPPGEQVRVTAHLDRATPEPRRRTRSRKNTRGRKSEG